MIPIIFCLYMDIEWNNLIYIISFIYGNSYYYPYPMLYM